MRRFLFVILVSCLGAMPLTAQEVFIEQNTQRWGGDYASFPVASGGALTCASECAGDPNCLAWTYARPGTENVQGVCHLKATVPHRVENPCCESGVVVGVSEATRPASVRALLRGEAQSAAVSHAP